MKITCVCGCFLPDNTDGLSHKAHLIADQDWEELWEEVDAAVEKSGPSAFLKEAACMRLQELSRAMFRHMSQCPNCGRLYIMDKDNHVYRFAPENAEPPKRLLTGRKGRATR